MAHQNFFSARTIVGRLTLAFIGRPGWVRHARRPTRSDKASLTHQIGTVPWESLQAGDNVLIHWRAAPVPGEMGHLPAGHRDSPHRRARRARAGRRAAGHRRRRRDHRARRSTSGTRSAASSRLAARTFPPTRCRATSSIENLDIRGARPPIPSPDDAGATRTLRGQRGGDLHREGRAHHGPQLHHHDSGNGLFVASGDSRRLAHILVEGNYIYGNGNAGSIFEHNIYTAAIGITSSTTASVRCAPARSGTISRTARPASSSATTGSRAATASSTWWTREDSASSSDDPRYRTTFVYGNVLIEPDGAGNSQIVHYGGDSGDTAELPQGHAVLLSTTRSSRTRTDRTTLFRLSTNDEHGDVRNNSSTSPRRVTVALLDAAGMLDISHNWFKPGWMSTFRRLGGVINDDGTTIVGASPGFTNESSQDFRLGAASPLRDRGDILHAAALPANDLTREVLKPQRAGESIRWLDRRRRVRIRRRSGGHAPRGDDGAQGWPGGSLLCRDTGRGRRLAALPLVARGRRPATRVVAQRPERRDQRHTCGRRLIRLRPTRGRRRSSSGRGGPDVSDCYRCRYAALVITTTSLPDARVGRDYGQVLQASGGLPPHVWSLSSGALPPGLIGSANQGTIAGRPTRTGVWSLVVRAQDSQSARATDTQALEIKVIN